MRSQDAGCRPNTATRLGGERNDLLSTFGWSSVNASGREERKQRNLACGGVRLSGGCAKRAGPRVHCAVGEWRACGAVRRCEDARNPSSNRPGGRSWWFERTGDFQLTSPPPGQSQLKAVTPGQSQLKAVTPGPKSSFGIFQLSGSRAALSRARASSEQVGASQRTPTAEKLKTWWEKLRATGHSHLEGDEEAGRGVGVRRRAVVWRLYGRRVYRGIRGRVARGVRCRARCVLQGFEDHQNPNSNRRPFVLHYPLVRKISFDLILLSLLSSWDAL